MQVSKKGSPIKKQKVLLTGTRSLFALDLARRLNEQGHLVYTAETSHFHVCRFSNACTKNFIVPSPRFETDSYIEALIRIVNEEGIDSLIPSWEEIFTIAQAKKRFPEKCQVICASYDTLDILHNKWRFNQKIAEQGFDTPQSFLIQTQEDLQKLDLKRPYILKLCYSRAAQKVYKVQENDPLPNIEVSPKQPWIAQQWIEGKKYCSYSIASKGRLTAHSVYPLQFSIDNSSCLNFEAIEHKPIHKWIEQLVKSLNFTGQVAFDFIETADGKLYAIECNPRGTSGIHLFQKAEGLSNAFFDFSPQMITPQVGYSKQLAIGMMLYGWKGQKLSRFLKTLFSVKDVVFSFSDLKPFFYQAILFMVYFFKSLKMRCNFITMFTFDTDWNGDEQLVCKHNL